MQVFKAYFKVIKRNLPAMLIYLFIFLMLTVLLDNFGGNKTDNAFSGTKSRVALMNGDGNSALAQGLKSYLARTADLVPLRDDTQSLQDALFYRNVDYIVRIPKGFSQSFLSGSPAVRIETTAVSGSTAAVNMDFVLNRYLNTAQLYVKNIPGITQADVAAKTSVNLQKQAPVQLKTYSQPKSDDKVFFYFNYLTYSLMAILILGITSIMMVFGETDLKKRSLCSPLRPLQMNLQLVLGSLLFSVAVWLVAVLISFALYGKAVMTFASSMLIANSFVFTLACLSIAFLAGIFIKSRGAQSAIANAFSLGTCFIGGVFVPQALLGKGVLTLASFTPTYWYVRVIDSLENLSEVTAASMQPIYNAMLIQLGFSAALFAVALVLAKRAHTAR